MDTNISEYNNSTPLTLKQTCEARLKQIESLDRSVLADEELKSVKNEIRELCLILYGIEVSCNK